MEPVFSSSVAYVEKNGSV